MVNIRDNDQISSTTGASSSTEMLLDKPNVLGFSNSMSPQSPYMFPNVSNSGTGHLVNKVHVTASNLKHNQYRGVVGTNSVLNVTPRLHGNLLFVRFMLKNCMHFLIFSFTNQTAEHEWSAPRLRLSTFEHNPPTISVWFRVFWKHGTLQKPQQVAGDRNHWRIQKAHCSCFAVPKSKYMVSSKKQN